MTSTVATGCLGWGCGHLEILYNMLQLTMFNQEALINFAQVFPACMYVVMYPLPQ